MSCYNMKSLMQMFYCDAITTAPPPLISGAAAGIGATATAQADKPEGQCDLPGCTNKKRTEGTTVYDYCCRDHATQDAPNRAGN